MAVENVIKNNFPCGIATAGNFMYNGNMQKTRTVRIGNIFIGDGNKIAVQSMTTTDTQDISSTISQINALANAGCDIVRFAVNNQQDAFAIKQLKQQTNLPLVADIQFDYKLAILSIQNGVDKVRINPGNLGGLDNFLRVLDMAAEHDASLRIGTNSGSIEPMFAHLKKEDALIESLMRYVNYAVGRNFYNLVLSIKCSSAVETVSANRKLSTLTDFPLHIGVTEAGTYNKSIIKSSIGIGSLLLDGIGDTIRVSITGDPLQEVDAAIKILQSCGKRKEFVDIISCPTCSRCKIDLKGIADEVEKRTKNIAKPLKIAIMGCVVNGPGEARDADIGLAAAKDKAVFFRNGEIFRTVEKNILEEFVKEVDKFVKE